MDSRLKWPPARTVCWVRVRAKACICGQRSERVVKGESSHPVPGQLR